MKQAEGRSLGAVRREVVFVDDGVDEEARVELVRRGCVDAQRKREFRGGVQEVQQRVEHLVCDLVLRCTGVSVLRVCLLPVEMHGR